MFNHRLLFCFWVFTAILWNAPAYSLTTYPDNLTGKFAETEVLCLSNSNQLYGYFTTNHKDVTQGTLPSIIQMQGTSITFTQKGGVLVSNPIPSESFYKIEATLQDDNQQSLVAFITLIDNLWADGVTTNGLSCGIDTTSSAKTYWYTHTQLKTASEVGQTNYDFSKRAQSKFLRRSNGQVNIQIYITPNGIYPVINGANFGSLPTLYTGSYTYQNSHPINYISLGKWDTSSNSVRFSNLRIVKLDSVINSVDEVCAHFIKKTAESQAFLNLISDEASMNGTAGFQNAMWASFLFRAYDYYWHTNHIDQVRNYFDMYLNGLTTYTNQNLPRYATEPTINVNHSFINSIQSNPVVLWGLRDYLRTDQIESARFQFARIVDTAMQYVKSDGSFPVSIQYHGDTFAEENSWLLCFFTGYYVNFPSDNENNRASKLLDYIKFLGFHHMSDNKSINQVYGSSVTFTHLNDSYRNFVSQYIWTDGLIDNHEFHPSVNYSFGVIGSAALARNLLEKRGVFIPTISRNLEICYNVNIKNRLNISAFRVATPNPRFDQYGNLRIEEDYYQFDADGVITMFSGRTKPSLVEDWSAPFTSFSVIENYGDYSTALTYARNIYYSYYTATGKLFCNGSSCSLSAENFYNYLFGDALYAMALSQRTSFNPIETTTNTPTKTSTPSYTKTNTPTATRTPTFTPTSTIAKTNTPSHTQTPISPSITPTKTSGTVKPCNRGDANCDSSITPGDALLTFQIYLQTQIPSGQELCDVLCAADINQDLSVTPGDSLCIFREYLRNPC